MAYNSSLPVTGGSLVAADIRENQRALKDDGLVIAADLVAAKKDPVAATAGLRTLGTAATAACAGNDARLSNERTPPDGSVTTAKLAASAVSQSKLKTSIGAVSARSDAANQVLTLPGGEYGFYPQCRHDGENSTGNITFKIWFIQSGTATSYATRICLDFANAYNTGFAQQRYITASGEVHWIFILRDKITKQTVSMYQAPDHPCFGNGGKPLLMPHPFGSYDETKHEIIVINPTNEEIEQMELETIVDDETKPDKDLLQIITENYEIDENSNPAWPTKEVTVGLPKHIVDKKTGEKVLADYRFMSPDTVVKPIKKVIPRPDYIKVKSLKRKNK